jgi:antitoxin VapB
MPKFIESSSDGSMALSIKHPEADRLVRELAAITHASYTEIVLVALREKLARETGRRHASRLRDEIARIQQRVARLPVLDARTPDEILGYDANGIPS